MSRNEGLVSLKKENYENLKDFLSSVFYRDDSAQLSKAAFMLVHKINSCGNFGLRASDWKIHVMDSFNVEQPEQGDKEIVDNMLAKYDLKRARGSKPIKALLSKHKKGKLKLPKDELEVLENYLVWNSAISGYYSIIKKLKAIGFIERKEGNYFLSSKLSDRLSQIKKIIKEIK